ncbi:MAG TPA: lipid A biosynthesis acyltransferase [Burkholderiales bacterium]|jgi:KDO2-lipid IV(A) lauroyltransferase|nr:lipid A biosynthesis acyltransferase [Burkholderiales bacterium]
MTRLVLALMWLVHWLPFGVIARIGEVVGTALFWLIPERRKVTRINLQKCFPEMDVRRREQLARAAFRAFCRGFVERSVLWWASAERVKRLVRVEGLEHLDAAPRVVMLAPHFAGVEAAGTRISIERDIATLYAHQKDPVLDRLLLRGRSRFRPQPKIVSRQEGFRRVLRWIKEGIPFYYLPDLDFGPKGSVFVPFFGVPAATARGLPYIARSTGAKVVPCVARMLPGGGYVAQLYPAWSDFPSGDDVADARRMMAFVEERVREMPEQYHWLHKRFKTRPEGEPKFY